MTLKQTPENLATDPNPLTQQSLAWSEIMQASDRLTQLAQQKDWEAVTQLHAERDQLLESFFNAPLHAELVPTVQADLPGIIQQDAVIVQLVQNNRDELGAEAQRLRNLKKRAEEYLSADQGKL